METSDWSVRQGHRLLQAGMLLFLFALLVGLVVPTFAMPRLGLSTHLLGIMQGVFLMVLGLLWPRLRVSAGDGADRCRPRGLWVCRGLGGESVGGNLGSGSCLDPTCSFSILPTISRRRLSAFETRSIHRLRSLPRATSCGPHRREQYLTHLPGPNCGNAPSCPSDGFSDVGQIAGRPAFAVLSR